MVSKQAMQTENNVWKTHKFMDYAATHPVALAYHKSDMVLAVYNNASYPSEHRACSHTDGNGFLAIDVPIPANNRTVLNTAQINKMWCKARQKLK